MSMASRSRIEWPLTANSTLENYDCPRDGGALGAKNEERFSVCMPDGLCVGSARTRRMGLQRQPVTKCIYTDKQHDTGVAV